MAKLEKDIFKYILKNKDTPILTFNYEKYREKTEILGEYTSYRFKNIEILNEKLLPPGFPNTRDSSELKKWIERRRIPKNRRNMI